MPADVCILYFDLGTHARARELAWMVRHTLPMFAHNFKGYGFEASAELADTARARFDGRHHVTIIHAALCNEPPEDGKVKLYKDGSDGLENSLYRRGFGEYEVVEAMRFSDWFKAQGFDVSKSICLLRMNIEGAELDVIADLLKSGLDHCIDGYFGMWDDLSKIDVHRSEAFRALLKERGIWPFTFNGRDFKVPLRLRCIEYEVATAVQVGLRRLSKG